MNLDCQSCGASLRVETQQRTTTCPYCAAPSVIERPASRTHADPAFAIGFAVTRDAAHAALRRWARSQTFRFRRSGLDRAPVEDVRGVYVPAYLYSAVAHTAWSANIGENYTETQTYTAIVNGKSVLRTRTVVKTEWRALSGRHATYVADVLVTGSRGIANAELEAVEPFDVRALKRYAPAMVSGWIAEDPSVHHAECLQLARAETVAAVGAKLAAFMPGDTHRDLQWQTHVERESLELVLVPLWVFAVRYQPDKPPMRVLVNGQTGRVYGRAPISWTKVLAAVAVVVAIVVAALLAAEYG